MNSMNVSDGQRLLAAAGYYSGGIDGKIGPKTKEAVRKIIEWNALDIKRDFSTWGDMRRLIAASQMILNHAGFEAGEVDGLYGHNTGEAIAAWDYEKTYGVKEVIDRTPLQPARPQKPTAALFPLQKDCPKYYGNPETGEPGRRLVKIDTYEMRFDWDLDEIINQISIHEKCADAATEAFKEIEKAYSKEKRRKLGLDRFAGSYNPRRMRGGTAWSMHAFGCAIDWFARPNGLRMRCPEALFCGPEYVTFFDIWESVGFISLGREIGRDWMHVQAARLS